MEIHIVQPEDTIQSIAAKYSISPSQLVKDNGLVPLNELVVGQTIVIAAPLRSYTVRNGDTLYSIANSHKVTVMDLLRNNPYLSNRKSIYPGECLVIDYDNSHGELKTNGYVYGFVNMDVLKKTLPFLTYLSVFNYTIIDGGEIDIITDDTEVVLLAKRYGVAPIMLLSTLTRLGTGNMEVAYSILNSEEKMNHLINNIVKILSTRGYYGVSLSYLFLDSNNQDVYNSFTVKLASRLKREGFLLFITLVPRLHSTCIENTFEKIDYTEIGRSANAVMVLSYDWGFSYGAPGINTSLDVLSDFLKYVLTTVPSEKIILGMSIIGYDWKLPYEVGISKANSLTTDSAIALARQTGASILYDESSQAAYFEYIDYSSKMPSSHIVWFKDARSVDATVKLAPQHGLQGNGIWNSMQFYSQMWVVMNSQYRFKKIVPFNPNIT
ncbi:MAG TPA: LysM peptidoglycan-binding domain-containing protein [Lachnospiraceae bacterium]|nr:LysM peptidoglycan-binding domain-containing protein [Lachnospiraceae bacterium]